jgi:hypothetical protein
MFSWLRVPVVKLRKIILTVAKRMRKNQILVITILKKKKTAKTIAPLAKPAVRDSFFRLF